MDNIEEREKKFEEIKEHLAIETSDDGFLYFLSPGMALQQDLTVDELDKLRELHIEMHYLFKEMLTCPDAAQYPNYVKKVEDIEFRMQEAWKFEKDATKHNWWYRVPNCQCPKVDNQERFGIAQRVVNGDCPVHGTLLKKDETK